jgi:hypothetical protein
LLLSPYLRPDRFAIPTGAYQDFLPRGIRQAPCAVFRRGKPHVVHQRNYFQQKIRGSAVDPRFYPLNCLYIFAGSAIAPTFGFLRLKNSSDDFTMT